MSEIIASPTVRALARAKGVALTELAQTLGRTTIGREDVESDSSAGKARDGMSHWDVDHSAYGAVREEQLTRFAQVSAANLSAANAHIPQVTHHDRAEVTSIDDLRASLKTEAQMRGIKLTALVFHVKALAYALTKFPRFNSSLAADGKTLVLKDYVHIAIAVDTEYGLMVPVLRDVGVKGIWQIASEITNLVARAQDRKIRPDEMGGTSITVTNLGGIGGMAFTPIVNPPQVAILGISRTETVTIWDGDKPRPVSMVPLDLSYDHRVINGAEAARFLTAYAGLIADPRRMLI